MKLALLPCVYQKTIRIKAGIISLEIFFNRKISLTYMQMTHDDGN